MKLISKYLLLLLVAIFAVSCGGDDVASGDATLVLTPSSSFTVVSSSSYITFTATLGSKDISKDSDLLVYCKTASGSVPVEGNKYLMNRAGTYTFYAIYGNSMSEIVEVRGISNLPDAVADTNPSKFDSFHKQILGTLVTGTWCSNCPTLLKQVHEYMEDSEVLIMSESHYNDIMESEASGYVIDKLGAYAYPTLYLGLSSASSNVIKNQSKASYIKKVVEAMALTPAKTAISANTKYSGNVVSVRADVKVAEEGQYRIGAFMVEDDVYALQGGASEDWMNYHEAAICASYPSNMVLTAPLGGEATQEAESTHMFYCEFDFKNLYSVTDRENCRIIVFTYNNAAKMVDNVIELDIDDSHAFKYNR